MNETTLQIISSLKILTVGVFATLYAFGGMRGKWLRRIIAPVVYISGILGFSLWTQSFSWWYLLCAPLLYGALTLPYGADVIKDKMIKRLLFGLACGAATLPIFIVNQAWSLLYLHIIVCTATSFTSGVFNQTSSARAEETLIGASLVLVPIFVI